MTVQEQIKKAIRHFECMKNDAMVVLDSGFGTHKGESDLVYRNRKMYAELAIEALEKQMPKKPNIVGEFIRLAECSECHTVIQFKQEYCHKCGVKIYWEEGGTSD